MDLCNIQNLNNCSKFELCKQYFYPEIDCYFIIFFIKIIINPLLHLYYYYYLIIYSSY